MPDQTQMHTPQTPSPVTPSSYLLTHSFSWNNWFRNCLPANVFFCIPVPQRISPAIRKPTSTRPHKLCNILRTDQVLSRKKKILILGWLCPADITSPCRNLDLETVRVRMAVPILLVCATDADAEEVICFGGVPCCFCSSQSSRA